MQAFCLRSTLAVLAWFTFLSGVSGRLNDKAHWKGQPKSTLKARAEAPIIEQRSPPEEFRFLDSATKCELSLPLVNFHTNPIPAYQVTSLPDVPYNIGEMYAGLVPIDERNKSRALYFIFQPTIGPKVDEITIWLNGGPGMSQTLAVVLSADERSLGCSSLEGFFQENGRFLWQSGQFAPELNPYSWVK